jgi:ketosteroid isomerase-like protein
VNENPRRNRNRGNAVELLRRLGEADFEGTAAMLRADFVQEYPYTPMPDAPSRIEGRDEFIAFCRPGMTAFEPYRYTIEAVYDLVEPDTVIVEYSSHSAVLADGAPYSNQYVGILWFDEAGLVSRWREYLNPKVIDAIMPHLAGQV